MELSLWFFLSCALQGTLVVIYFGRNQCLDMAKTHLQFIAEHCEDKEIVAIVGLPMIYRSKLYNVAAVIYDGEILGLVPKTYIPNYSEFYEGTSFYRSEQENKERICNDMAREEVPIWNRDLCLIVLILKTLRFAIEICEDLWVPNPPSTSHALAGATVIANLSASDETTGKDIYRTGLGKQVSQQELLAHIFMQMQERVNLLRTWFLRGTIL